MPDRFVPGTTPEAPRHYVMELDTDYYKPLISVEMCRHPYEGQICAAKGGIRPLFKSLIVWEGTRYDMRAAKYVPLYKWIRSYYVN